MNKNSKKTTINKLIKIKDNKDNKIIKNSKNSKNNNIKDNNIKDNNIKDNNIKDNNIKDNNGDNEDNEDNEYNEDNENNENNENNEKNNESENNESEDDESENDESENDESENDTDTDITKKNTLLELSIIDKANENKYFHYKTEKEPIYINFDDKHYPLLTEYEIITIKTIINYIKPANKDLYSFVKEIREVNYCDIEIKRHIGNIIVIINIKELEWEIEDLLD